MGTTPKPETFNACPHCRGRVLRRFHASAVLPGPFPPLQELIVCARCGAAAPVETWNMRAETEPETKPQESREQWPAGFVTCPDCDETGFTMGDVGTFSVSFRCSICGSSFEDLGLRGGIRRIPFVPPGGPRYEPFCGHTVPGGN